MSNESIYTDKELFNAIAEGDEAAFRQLFHLYLPTLYPMIFRVAKTESATEDILQETFLRLWIHRDKLPEIETPRAWILRIAYFQAFTFLRKKATHQKMIDKLATKGGEESLSSNTEEMVSFNNLQASVRKAVQELPPQQKKIYQLSRERGLKNKEIAGLLGLSEQSVKNTLVRALKFIREEVEKGGHVIFSLLLAVIQFYNEY
ncbi:MAG TPA: RNA polymerase sigma-70 factor [Chitinophagaceae bacterium]